MNNNIVSHYTNMDLYFLDLASTWFWVPARKSKSYFLPMMEVCSNRLILSHTDFLILIQLKTRRCFAMRDFTSTLWINKVIFFKQGTIFCNVSNNNLQKGCWGLCGHEFGKCKSEERWSHTARLSNLVVRWTWLR